MQGIEIICLFFPTFISLIIDTKINNKKSENVLIKYGVYNFGINFITSLLIWFITDNKSGTYFYTFSFVVKYMSVSLITSIILPIIVKIQKVYFNISLKIKEKQDEYN